MEFLCTIVDGPRPGALEQLEGWLRDDPSLGLRTNRLQRPPASGEMGTIADALVVAVGAGGAVTVLASAVAAWLSLPQSRGLRLRIEDRADGSRLVEIDAEMVRTSDVEALIDRSLSRD